MPLVDDEVSEQPRHEVTIGRSADALLSDRER